MTSEDCDSVRPLKDRSSSSSSWSDQNDSSSSYEDLSGLSRGSTPSPPAFEDFCPLETCIASDYLSGTQADLKDLDARVADEEIEDLGHFETGINTRDAFEDSRQLEGGINTREADEALEVIGQLEAGINTLESDEAFEDFGHSETGISALKANEKTCTDFGQLEACVVSKDVDTREADETLEVIGQLEAGINTLESDEAFEEFDQLKAGIAFEDFDEADDASENNSPIEVSSSSDDGFSPSHVASPFPGKRSTLVGYPSLSQRYIRRLRITPLQYKQLLQSYMNRVRSEVLRMTGGDPRRVAEASPKFVYTGPLYFVQDSPGSPPTYLLPPVDLLVMMRNRLFFLPDDKNQSPIILR